MIYAKNKGIRYGIQFSYFRKKDKKGNRHRQDTTCSIYELDDNLQAEDMCLIDEGSAWLHPSDNFCAETGRKIALSSALKRRDRIFRSSMWKAYLNRNNLVVVTIEKEDVRDDEGRIFGEGC